MSYASERHNDKQVMLHGFWKGYLTPLLKSDRLWSPDPSPKCASDALRLINEEAEQCTDNVFKPPRKRPT